MQVIKKDLFFLLFLFIAKIFNKQSNDEAEMVLKFFLPDFIFNCLNIVVSQFLGKKRIFKNLRKTSCHIASTDACFGIKRGSFSCMGKLAFIIQCYSKGCPFPVLIAQRNLQRV